MGIALANNDVVWFFKKGSGLPLKKRSEQVFRTIRGMKVGEPEMVIRVPVIEGENDAADRNRNVGNLDITSEQIRRDLAAGSELEVTLSMNESRIITVNVYVRILDEEFENILDLTKSSNPNVEADLSSELKRLDSLISQAETAEDSVAVKKLGQIRSSSLVAEIKDCVEAAKGDEDAAQKAEKRLLELKLLLDEAENSIKWPTAVSDIRGWLDDMDKLVRQHGTSEQLSRAGQLAREAEEIISKKEADRLPGKQRQVEDLYFQILFSIPAFWVNQFQRLVDERGKMNDQAQADRLIEMGHKYLEKNNLDGLRNVVGKLWNLLPKRVVDQIQRGFGSTLTR
jgi:molecular chaperone DnaK